MWPMGQLSDPYQQGDDDELGITISGLPGEMHEPEGDAPPSSAEPVSGASGESDDAVVYDLGDWSAIERQAITERLTEAGIPHGWQDTALQVAAVDEAAVENVLDIVEGESDDADGEPLDAERDQVAYDLSEWEDDQIDLLVAALREAEVAHAWDGDEMYVYSEDEGTVDDLFDKVSHPHELAAEDDDGAVGGETMGELFLASDRLQSDPDDKQGTRSLLDLDEAVDPEAPPYGLGAPEWKHVCERVEALAELLRSDVLDEEAAIEAARDLRNALRPFV